MSRKWLFYPGLSCPIPERVATLAGLLEKRYIVGTFPVIPFNGTHVAKPWGLGGRQTIDGKGNLNTPPMITAII
jgi:hypothetical protein